MNAHTRSLLAGLVGLLLSAGAVAQPISYQGFAEDGGAPADGTYDFEFRVYDAATGGAAQGLAITADNVVVTGGVFDVDLDFAADIFGGGADRWLEVRMRPGSGGSYSTLTPRTRLGATPTALSLPLVHVKEVSSFVGINRANRIGGAEFFGLRAPVTSGYGGMYITTDGASGLPFYGYYNTDGSSMWHYFDGPTGDWRVFNGADRLTVKSNGRVGIGTTVPSAQLQVSADGINAVAGRQSGTVGFAGYFTNFNTAANQQVVRVYNDGLGPTVIAHANNASNDDAGLGANHYGVGPALYGRAFSTGEAGQFRGGNVSFLDAAGNAEMTFEDNANQGAGVFRMYDSNGTTTTVRIVGDELGNDGAQLDMYDDNGTNTVTIDAENTDEGGALVQLRDGDGSSTITLDADYFNGGNSRIITDEIQLNGSDLAEHFDVAPAPSAINFAPVAGTVVCIDPAEPGRLVVCSAAYDRTVAGVISGAGGVRPGIYMGQPGTLADGEHPVAIAGRVYVQADAAHGPIRPGDLLTTTATPGHAMLATDGARSQGAILGKAMSSLEEGTGLVLVLVSLQ